MATIKIRKPNKPIIIKRVVPKEIPKPKPKPYKGKIKRYA